MEGTRAETEIVARLLARGYNEHIRAHGPDDSFAYEVVESGDGHGLVIMRGGAAFSVQVGRAAVLARREPGAEPRLCVLGAGQRLYALTTSTSGGDAVTLHLSEDAARAELAGFARQFWDEIADYEGRAAPGVTGPPPDDDEEAIRIYFEHQGDEGYTITETALPQAGQLREGP
jgi:hypothetical protein